jgi:nucleotide-binding universal stress UspA family protein
MKSLLAVITPVSDDGLGSAVHYALAVASHVGAHLTILIAEIGPDVFAPTAVPDNMQGLNEITDPPSKAERVTRTIELARAAAALRNVSCTVLNGDSPSLPDLLVERAQLHDCTILDVRGPLRHPRQTFVEGVLFGSGRPIILTPPQALPSAEEIILIAWDATRSAARALHDAIPLLARAREVVIVSVSDDKEFRAVESGPHVCHYLRRWGVTSRFALIEPSGQSVGGALVEYAVQVQARLLVMGGFGHAREREFLFGSATRDIFESNLEIAVLLSH